MWEGGLRVPSIIEWPSMIKPKKTNYPASTMDIFPTIAEIVGLPESEMLKPIDGVSIVPVFNSKIKKRENKCNSYWQREKALFHLEKNAT